MCTYLTRREGGMYCFRRPVPKDLRGVIGQREWSQSLKTKDRREAEPLALALALETCQIIKEARERLAGVTHPAALEGSPARSPAPSGAMSEPEVEAAAFQAEDTAESEARWELRQEARDLLRERMKISTRELSPSEAAIKDLLRERDFDLALAGDRLLSARVELDALRRTARSADISAGAASGDASPTGTEPPVKLMPLFDGYVAEVQPTASTVTSWRPYIRHLAAFLGHDDASRITTADLRRWKERLQTEEIAPGRVRKPRTIKDGHIAAIKVVLGWAEENGKLPSNPAIGVKIRVPKVAKVRDRGFTNEEAETILAASLHPVEGRMAEGYKLARRWVPWLTGPEPVADRLVVPDESGDESAERHAVGQRRNLSFVQADVHELGCTFGSQLSVQQALESGLGQLPHVLSAGHVGRHIGVVCPDFIPTETHDHPFDRQPSGGWRQALARARRDRGGRP